MPNATGRKSKKLARFTTIKVREEVRRWIKSEAAKNDLPMYAFIEQIMAKSLRGQRPWEAT